VAETVRDLTPIERQLVITVSQEKRGNPLYNQRQLESEDLTARLGAEFAARVLLPENDPTEQAEQLRQQQLELTLLGHGEPVPVSPRDNHLIHLNALMPAAEQIAGGMSQGQFTTDVLETVVAHMQEHFTQAMKQGGDKEALAPIKEFLDKAAKELGSLKEIDQQAQQVSAQHEALAAGESPVAPPPMG
jgi:hypothetical protein